MQTEEKKPATSSQREAIGQALIFSLIPTDLTEAEADAYLEKIDEIAAPSATVALSIIRPPAKITIIAEFKLNGEYFDAVLVHQNGEDHVLGEKAIQRADEDRSDVKVVRSEEDWEFVYDHRGELPSKLNDFWLATARPYPGLPRGVSSLLRGSRGWCGCWLGLDDVWPRYALVLRRRT